MIEIFKILVNSNISIIIASQERNFVLVLLHVIMLGIIITYLEVSIWLRGLETILHYCDIYSGQVQFLLAFASVLWLSEP